MTAPLSLAFLFHWTVAPHVTCIWLPTTKTSTFCTELLIFLLTESPTLHSSYLHWLWSSIGPFTGLTTSFHRYWSLLATFLLFVSVPSRILARNPRQNDICTFSIHSCIVKVLWPLQLDLHSHIRDQSTHKPVQLFRFCQISILRHIAWKRNTKYATDSHAY